VRMAIISDIHGNCVALDAVLNDLSVEGIDQVVCLGDAIQGGPQPAQTVQRLRQLGCAVVLGNADAFLLTGADEGSTAPVTEAQLRVRAWSLAQLSESDVALIKGFPPTVDIALDSGVHLFCFHGSPASFNELIFPETPEEELQPMLGAYRGRIMCGGHTHLQQIRRIGDYFFFNPGSVGLAYNRDQPEESFGIDPWAEYALLQADGKARVSLDLRRVPHSVDELLKAYESSGRPHYEQMIEQYRRGAIRLQAGG
jgi:predicted phosphodiesterase